MNRKTNKATNYNPREKPELSRTQIDREMKKGGLNHQLCVTKTGDLTRSYYERP